MMYHADKWLFSLFSVKRYRLSLAGSVYLFLKYKKKKIKEKKTRNYYVQFQKQFTILVLSALHVWHEAGIDYESIRVNDTGFVFSLLLL